MCFEGKIAVNYYLINVELLGLHGEYNPPKIYRLFGLVCITVNFRVGVGLGKGSGLR